MATTLPNTAASSATVPQSGSDKSRFGIGEWYGQSFFHLSPQDRRAFAEYSQPTGAALSTVKRNRLIFLRNKQVSTAGLSQKEESILLNLEVQLKKEQDLIKYCPFKSGDALGLKPCTKKGGVCSLRLYEPEPAGGVRPVTGARGSLRVTCPSRFHEENIVFIWASEAILNQPAPALVGEVGFLESSESVDGSEGEDVGRIDMVIVDASKPADYPLPWLALEIQAVYFSGPEMKKLFDQIVANVTSGGNGAVYPDEVRRPDYRSSGPKRLMPQLQIKVPTLRRWGKRMAIVVDRPFYDSMGTMETVGDVSNADIAWFVIDFDLNTSSGRFELGRGNMFFMTLEEAVKGLTGGSPVTLNNFEGRIKNNISSHD